MPNKVNVGYVHHPAQTNCKHMKNVRKKQTKHNTDGCHGVPLSSRSGTSVPRRPSHHIL